VTKYRVQCQAEGCEFVFNALNLKMALWIIKEHVRMHPDHHGEVKIS
jgi:hypothetical protein